MSRLTSVFAVLGAMVMCFAVEQARAEVTFPFAGLTLYNNITVANTTNVPVQFNQSAATCVESAPASFTVAANGSQFIEVVWRLKDEGTDNCYARNHTIEYRDAANGNNFLRIQQYSSSDNYACLGFKLWIVFEVGQAVCPEFGGNVIGPSTNSDDNGVYCPPGVPTCPPRDSTDPDLNWGFAIKAATLEDGAAIRPIPTLQQWGALLLAVLILLAGRWRTMRRS